MRVWPSKGEQRPKLPKKSSFASKEVLCKTPPKFSDFSCELGKCTENPKYNLKICICFYRTVGSCRRLFFMQRSSFIKCGWGEAESSIVPFSRSLAILWEITIAGRAALCKEEMPYVPAKLCQGKDKHFPTCLVLGRVSHLSVVGEVMPVVVPAQRWTQGVLSSYMWMRSPYHTYRLWGRTFSKRLSITCQRFM